VLGFRASPCVASPARELSRRIVAQVDVALLTPFIPELRPAAHENTGSVQPHQGGQLPGSTGCVQRIIARVHVPCRDDAPGKAR